MKKAFLITLLALAPVSAFANAENLVNVFETYCHSQIKNPMPLDSAIPDHNNASQEKYNQIRGQGDNGYIMIFNKQPFLIEWIGEACRVSTNGAIPNNVMKALATNHMLSISHGDKTNFRRALWFEQNHLLTKYAFTHDLSHNTIILEYQKDDAMISSPVAITLTR